jgi:hypothetical protein
MFSILTKQYRIETEEEYIKWMMMAKYRPKKQKNVGKWFETVFNGNNLQKPTNCHNGCTSLWILLIHLGLNFIVLV